MDARAEGLDPDTMSAEELDARGAAIIDRWNAEAIVPDSWNWFRVQHIPFRGGLYTVVFDRDGTKYGKGSGLRIEKE